MNRNIFLLALCQAVYMTGVSLVVAVSGLVGKELSPYPILATLPMSSQHIATMCAVLPAAFFMSRLSRNEVFRNGALIGSFGFLVAAVGIVIGNFWVMVFGSVFIGMHNAVGQFYRFAAAESVGKELRSRAISLTLAGGVIASLLGPFIANTTKDLLAPRFSASYLSLVALTMLGSYIASKLNLQGPVEPAQPAAAEAPRALAEIVKQPIFIVAAVASMLGFGEMTLLMTATPLAMDLCGHSFTATASVISWHMFCMFAPSFFTGDLIRRFGALPVIMTGTLLLFLSITINLNGSTLGHFQIALMVLGVAWNFMYVGGTSLLTRSYRASEKAKVQGTNDTLVMATLGLASLSAGFLEESYGWEATNIAAIPGALIVVISVAWLWAAETKRAKVSPLAEAARS